MHLCVIDAKVSKCIYLDHLRNNTAKNLVFGLIVALLLFCGGCASNSGHRADTDKVKVITLWHPWGGVQKELLLTVISEFNRTHPGIRVQPLFNPTDPGSGGSSQKFFTAVAANRAPDVVFVDGSQTASWAEQGSLQPLDDQIKADKIKPGDYFTPCWEQNYYNGHVWALTYCADPNFAFAWNKKVFREVGLDPEKPPTTIAELDKCNDIITHFENGKMIRIGFIPWAQYGVANSLYTWGWVFGGSFYDPKTQKVTADNQKILKAMEWMVSYSKKYDIKKIAAFSSGFGSRDQNPFYTGQLAMTCLHISELNNIKQYAPNLDFGLSYIPYAPGGEKRSSWVGGWCLSLPKGSKHPKEAWEFIKWCCRDPRGTSVIGRTQSLFPGYKNSPYFNTIEGKPGYREFLLIMRECRHQRPVMAAQTFYVTALNKAVDYTLYGRLTSRQALENATKDTQAELNLRLAGK